MQIYYSEHPLDEGFAALDADRKEDRLARGKRVSRPSGWALFSHMRGGAIRCRFCHCLADRWVVGKGPSDHVGTPVMNLYAGTHMMTRDHFIPKSLGGVDAVKNLRPACAPCNESRSNKVNKNVIKFALHHPELIDQERIRKGLESLAAHIKRLRANPKHDKAEIERLQEPYRQMGYIK